MKKECLDFKGKEKIHTANVGVGEKSRAQVRTSHAQKNDRQYIRPS
jgi:hypothetical protein